MSSARGTVLDLGPGTGNQLDRFDASKVDHVYGVEPNTAFTERFVKRLQECKLGQDGKYTLVPCGIENHEVLHRFGIAEESVDCIVSMQVMVGTHYPHMSLILPELLGPKVVCLARRADA